MGRNLELKIKLNDFSDIRKGLTESGAVYKDTLPQTDIYYNAGEFLLKLRIEKDTFQLIRYRRNEGEGERWSDYKILFLTGDNPEEFLSAIFPEVIRVVKERKLYMFGFTRIHLDTVEGLGKFLEFETVVQNGNEKDAEREFVWLKKKLEINDYPEIKTSYRYLREEALKNDTDKRD